MYFSAHNIEDFSRSTASSSFNNITLNSILSQLCILSSSDLVAFKSLFELFKGLSDWFDKVTDTLTYEDFKNGNNVWSGEEIIQIFSSDFGLSPDTLPIYIEHMRTVLADNEDINSLIGNTFLEEQKTSDEQLEFETTTTSIKDKLPASASFFIKDLMKVLSYLYAKETDNAKSYKIVIEHDRQHNSAFGAKNYILHFWCLSPAIVFREIQDLSHSILLTRYVDILHTLYKDPGIV